MHIMDQLVSQFRSLAVKLCQLCDSTMEQSRLLFGIQQVNFLLYVLIPATTVRLIQEDEEQASGRVLAFSDTFNILVEMSS